MSTTPSARKANRQARRTGGTSLTFHSMTAFPLKRQLMVITSSATAEVLGPGRIIGQFRQTPAIMADPPNAAPPASRGDIATGSAEASFALLLRAKAGDEHAREALFARYLPRVRRWAHGRLPSHSRSLLNTDDLAQEVLCRAVVSLEKFDPPRRGLSGVPPADHAPAFVQKCGAHGARCGEPLEDSMRLRIVATARDWARSARTLRAALQRLKPRAELMWRGSSSIYNDRCRPS